MTPPIVPANTSFADFTSVALSALGGSAADAANGSAAAPALNLVRGWYARVGAPTGILVCDATTRVPR